jgi:hypothetical protein
VGGRQRAAERGREVPALDASDVLERYARWVGQARRPAPV